MGKQKKFLSDLLSNILASALWERVISPLLSLAIAWVLQSRILDFSPFYSWAHSMNISSIISFGVPIVGLGTIIYIILNVVAMPVKNILKKRILYSYKFIGFQQHWYHPNLVELAHGVKTKGIGIKLNNKGNKNIINLTVEMKQLFYKKDLSEEFKNISIEPQPFWWDLGNNHSTTLEELESTIGHAILMLASPLPVFPQFVFMTSATSPDSNISGIPRNDGYYKVLLQFSGSIKNSRNKMKPILFRAKFRYKDFEFSEYDGQGYVELE